jgi:hypothetical protein
MTSVSTLGENWFSDHGSVGGSGRLDQWSGSQVSVAKGNWSHQLQGSQMAHGKAEVSPAGPALGDTPTA